VLHSKPEYEPLNPTADCRPYMSLVVFSYQVTRMIPETKSSNRGPVAESNNLNPSGISISIRWVSTQGNPCTATIL
jgi:hypothetical protein